MLFDVKTYINLYIKKSYLPKKMKTIIKIAGIKSPFSSATSGSLVVVSN